MTERTYTLADMARAWREGAEYAWNRTGEGLNGEYAPGYGTHDGTASFHAVVDDILNPYEQEEA